MSSVLDVDELSTGLRYHLQVSTAIPPVASVAVVAVTVTKAPVVEGAVVDEKATAETVKESKDVKVAVAVAVAVADTVKAESSQYDRWTELDAASVDYGYLGATGGKGIENSADEPNSFYITTAINYTNGPAHMGHAYEGVTTDVIARFHRLLGNQPTYFVTGADEHGQKIANTAAELGKKPIEICNQYVTGFKVLNQRSLVSFDDYVRTTSDRHKRTAQEVWKRCAAADDIYLDTYSGWYNEREETFVTDNEAALADYKDPSSGLPLKKVEEESYFFKMSRYKDRLIHYIETENPLFIQPEVHRNFILQRLRNDDLRDLSISRTTFDWGIAVPEGFHSTHVMYVWLDALSNYLTGVNGLGVNNDDSSPSLTKFWPANVHIIGKDILWFHTVIWPCLLMSANVPLPKSVFAHGFVNDKEGKKMSKSLGNVMDPHDMLDRFEVDTFRWYLCKEAPYGGELAFSEDSMQDMHNADLCDTLGNLVHRATNLCHKFCDGVVPDVKAELPINLTEIISSYTNKMNRFELQGGANLAIQGFRDVNGYLQEAAPWALKGDEDTEKRQIIVRTALECIYALSHLLLPFIPVGGSKIFRKLHTEPVPLLELKQDGTNLKVGTPIEIGDVLYTKALSEAEIKDAKAEASKKKESYADAQARKKESKAKAMAASKQGQASADQSEFTMMDIRVGKIVKVWNHEKADKLFCEQIDLGTETREIASGLRGHYTLDEMQDRKVLVVCNLKAAKLFDFVSDGMVLAAKGGEKVELVEPPADATLGERVFIEGLTGEPASSTQVKKKKIWETVAKELRTGEKGIVTWMDKVVQTTTGPCKVSTLVGAPVS